MKSRFFPKVHLSGKSKLTLIYLGAVGTTTIGWVVWERLENPMPLAWNQKVGSSPSGAWGPDGVFGRIESWRWQRVTGRYEIETAKLKLKGTAWGSSESPSRIFHFKTDGTLEILPRKTAIDETFTLLQGASYEFFPDKGFAARPENNHGRGRSKGKNIVFKKDGKEITWGNIGYNGRRFSLILSRFPKPNWDVEFIGLRSTDPSSG